MSIQRIITTHLKLGIKLLVNKGGNATNTSRIMQKKCKIVQNSLHSKASYLNRTIVTFYYLSRNSLEIRFPSV